MERDGAHLRLTRAAARRQWAQGDPAASPALRPQWLFTCRNAGAAGSGCPQGLAKPHRPSWRHRPSAHIRTLLFASAWPRNSISGKTQSLRVCFLFSGWSNRGAGRDDGSRSPVRAAGWADVLRRRASSSAQSWRPSCVG